VLLLGVVVEVPPVPEPLIEPPGVLVVPVELELLLCGVVGPVVDAPVPLDVPLVPPLEEPALAPPDAPPPAPPPPPPP
jgi:hypothetical protein